MQPEGDAVTTGQKETVRSARVGRYFVAEAIMTVRAHIDTPAREVAGPRTQSGLPTPGESLTRLVEALLRPGGIEMAAQPIVSVADGSTLGFEMLARTSIPCSSGPDQWLEHASYLGVRTELELACLEAVAERGSPPGEVRLFVNLSARTLLDPRVDAVLNQLPPRVLEITEHEPVSDYQELRRRLDMWSAASTMLAIDDVGAGYSSMSHVLQLHPQFIKIDRSLVHKAHRDPNKLAVLRGLVGFARQCGITSLAEGVETSEELNALRAVGIDLVQGYLLARPGEGWPKPRRWRSASGLAGPSGNDDSSTIVESLLERVDKTIDPSDAADVVTAHLHEHFGFLPSVYVERAGVLRFLAGRGQWQVLDGIEGGVGLTGSAFAAGEPILVQDVSADDRYREAVPGVAAELAVPLVVQRRIVGVLNVDAPAPIDGSQADAVLAAAHVLEDAFARTGLTSSWGSPMVDLGWHAPRIAESQTTGELAGSTVSASVAVARLQSAVLWTWSKGELVQQGSTGARADDIARLTSVEREQLAELVSHVASSYSTGPVISRTFGSMGLLRDMGFGTVFVAAIRDRGVPSGLLVLAGPDAGIIQAEAVQALELLSVLAGVTLARIGAA
jgi:EAL domain-containing protein (putative c-di-GMP-specific phosphodiesterase class I)/putative methionine-R-sulfoxide reductase with GAF domain